MDMNLLGYDRQLAMSKIGGVNALLHSQAQSQHGKPGGIGTSGSQTSYDGGYQMGQQLMYYQ